jgi:HlyD family secretion protein
MEKLNNAVNYKQENYQSLLRLQQEGAVPGNELKNAREDLNAALLEQEIYENQYLLDLRNRIETNEKNYHELSKTIRDNQISLEDTVVTAPIRGVVNMATEINEGDLLQSGAEVATIVPKNNSCYKVQLSVPNQDIANIRIGSEVRFHFLALPYKEYGELRGEVTNIGVDAKTDEQKGTYYLVEASLENRPIYSYKGVKAELKVGMQCEAWVVAKTQKMLYFLLEKINLKD